MTDARHPNSAAPETAGETSASDQRLAANTPPRSYHWLIPFMAAAMTMGLLVLIYLGRYETPVIDGPMPDTELVGLIEASGELPASELTGRIVVLHFWGPWCGPCRAEYPEFAELIERYADDPAVRIVSVSSSGGADDRDLASLQEQTLEFLRSIDASPHPVYADPNLYTRTQIAKLSSGGSFGYPTTIIGDANGMARYFIQGMSEPGEISEAIESLRSSLSSSQL